MADRENLQNSRNKRILNFLTNHFNLYGIPEKIKADKPGGGVCIIQIQRICKSRNIEIQDCPPRNHTGNGTIARAIQTIKMLLLANIEDGNNLTESVYRPLKVMRFTIHTGLKKTPFELHHSSKPRTELTNIINDEKSSLSDWSELSILAPNMPKIPIYVGKDAEGEITNHMVMARTKTEERQLASETKSPEKKIAKTST